MQCLHARGRVKLLIYGNTPFSLTGKSPQKKEGTMYLKQGDLFWGMSNDFVKQVMDETEKRTYNEGEILFKEGGKAAHFYILLKGRVKLSIGEDGPTVFIAKQPALVLGWSTLLGRVQYSASAQVLEDSVLIKVAKESFLDRLNKDPEASAIFFERVARMLGERLISVYPSLV